MTRPAKLIIASIITLGILIPIFPIAPVPDAEADVVVDTVGCLGGATVGVVIDSAVSFVGSWVSKILGGPTFTIEVQNINKEYILDTVERCFARAVLDNTIAAMLDIIRTKGRDGDVAYVKNWRNFQTNAQYRGENVFRTILANTKLCEHLQQDVRDVFGVTDKFRQSLQGQNIRVGDLDPYTLKARCSLPDNFDIEEYNRDFAGNGGWDRLVQLARPENNFYGALLQSYEELEKQRALEIAANLYEAQAGSGYTSIRGDSASTSCLVRGINGKCIVYADIKSPASYVADIAQGTINAEFNWITSVDEYKEMVVHEISKRLTERLLNLGSSESDPTYDTDQVPHNIAPTPPPGYVTPTPFPPNPNPDPNPDPGTGSCAQEIPSGNSGPFGGDVAAAQEQIKASSPNIVNSGNQVLDINAYFSEMERILEGRGYIVTRDPNAPDQEINIYLAGASSSEQYAIRTSGGQTRNAWKGTGCPLP
ncbi:MAG: hypothetical protein Q8P35_02740 [Candidatus Yanofskybacteria bacterium]|nr:hypothetical protein [Candidatus Yanofskybacteria bacterium]